MRLDHAEFLAIAGRLRANKQEERFMRKIIGSIVIVGMMYGAMAVPAVAQDKTQTVTLAKVDVVALTAGHRASKIIGGTVVNAAGDKVGTVDDIIIGSDGKGVYAILSVGGFLGVDTKLVAVDYTSLQISADKIELSGASKDSLEQLPAFTYAQ